MDQKKINTFRKKIKQNCLIGSWFQLPIYDIGSIIDNNFDWYCIDLEHGLIDFKDVNYMLNSLRLKNAPVICRININNLHLCARLLDFGIDGFIFANTNNLKDIQNIKSECLFPPKGNRGIGYAKYNNFSFKGENLKNRPILIPMIEKKECVDNLDQILKEKNLDGFFIGPVDLSASYKKFEKGNHNSISQIISKIRFLAKKNSVPLGFHSIFPDKKKINTNIKKKFNFIAFSTDSVIIKRFYKI